MTRESFAKLVREGTVLLDGATGSNLYRAGMPRDVCPEQWICEHEDVITELQKAYAAAGSRKIGRAHV